MSIGNMHRICVYFISSLYSHIIKLQRAYTALLSSSRFLRHCLLLLHHCAALGFGILRILLGANNDYKCFSLTAAYEY